MSEKDAQDLNQMMSSRNSEMPTIQSGKSKLGWIVLGCIVVGVGLGVVVYQQSIEESPKPAVKTGSTTTEKKPVVTPPVASPIAPQTLVVNPTNTPITFPKNGKLRVFTNIPNIQLVLSLTIAGQAKQLTIVNKRIDATTKMAFADSTFDVVAGSSATVDAYLNSMSGAKMRGWIPPTGNLCGDGQNKVDLTPMISWAQGNLSAGETIFSKQCFEDDDTPGEFNDFVLLWSYAPVVASPSVAASSSPSPSVAVSPSPSPSRAASPSPSPSARASVTPTPTPTATPTPSPRVSMPDTSGGTPVTGIFEITAGTVSMGIVLLILGLFGLLVL